MSLAFAGLVLGFLVIFGHPNGLFGAVLPSLDLSLKAKLINSLAVFGAASIGIGIWLLSAEDRKASAAVVPMIFALWLSLTYGFVSVDCSVFTFCDRPEAGTTPDCSVQHDRQGAHIDCK